MLRAIIPIRRTAVPPLIRFCHLFSQQVTSRAQWGWSFVYLWNWCELSGILPGEVSIARETSAALRYVLPAREEQQWTMKGLHDLFTNFCVSFSSIARPKSKEIRMVQPLAYAALAWPSFVSKSFSSMCVRSLTTKSLIFPPDSSCFLFARVSSRTWARFFPVIRRASGGSRDSSNKTRISSRNFANFWASRRDIRPSDCLFSSSNRFTSKCWLPAVTLKREVDVRRSRPWLFILPESTRNENFLFGIILRDEARRDDQRIDQQSSEHSDLQI